MDEILLKHLVKLHLQECLQYRGQRGVIQVFDPAGWQPNKDKKVIIAFLPLDELAHDIRSVVSHRYLSRAWNFENEFIAMLVPSIRALAIRCTQCGSSQKPFRCGRCKHTVYCSTQCQKKDWEKHKLQCTPSLDGHSRREDFEKKRLVSGEKVELPKNLSTVVIGYNWSMVRSWS